MQDNNNNTTQEIQPKEQNNNYIIYIYGYELHRTTGQRLSDSMASKYTAIFNAPSEEKAIEMFFSRCKSDFGGNIKVYEDMDVQSFSVYERKSYYKKEFIKKI